MRISGLLRYDINFDTREDLWTYTPEQYDFDYGWAVVAVNDFDDPGFFNGIGVGPVVVLDSYTPGYYTLTRRGGDEGWQKTALARVNVDVRSETEFGTFRRYIRLEGSVNSGSNGSAINIIHAYVELGGLLVGLYDTLYDGTVPNMDMDNGGGSRTHQIRYTFNAGNGVTAQLAVEEEDYNYDYTPNVVGRLGITQGWGSLAVFAAYDATAEEWAAKGLLNVKFGGGFAFDAIGTYESGYSAYSVTGPNFSGYEWSLGGYLSAKMDKFTVWGGGQYFGDSHFGGFDEWNLGVQADYRVAENLLLRTWVKYNDSNSPLDSFWDGRIRLESSF
jgi:hypothetical protein